MTNAECYNIYGDLQYLSKIETKKLSDGRVVGRMFCAICVGSGSAHDAEYYDSKCGWYVHKLCAQEAKNGMKISSREKWKTMSLQESLKVELME